jgi:hypothetical protein
MIEKTQPNDQSIEDSPMIDFDTPVESSPESSTATTPVFPQLPAPPRPPPRRRKRQTAIFYSSIPPLFTTLIDDMKDTPEAKSRVPPPIPPRSSSINESPIRKNSLDDMTLNEKSKSSSEQSLFSSEELIDNLMQNLTVMEELNYSLRTELKKYREENANLSNELKKYREGNANLSNEKKYREENAKLSNELKKYREENANLSNELAAIYIERDQLLQTCKEIDELKDNELLCSICLDDRKLIVSKSRQIVATFCGHLFCNDCVKKALDIESVCPTCRKPIPQKNFREAFHCLYF